MTTPFIPRKPVPRFVGVEMDEDTAATLQYTHSRTGWTKTALVIFAIRHTYGEDPPKDPRAQPAT